MSDSKTIQQRAEEQLVELQKDIDKLINTFMSPEQKVFFEELSELEKAEFIRHIINSYKRLEVKILSKWNLEKII